MTLTTEEIQKMAVKALEIAEEASTTANSNAITIGPIAAAILAEGLREAEGVTDALLGE